MNLMPAGSYIEGGSVIHRLDAFVKLLCIFLIFAAIILCDTLPGYALVIFVIASAITLSGIGLSGALGAVRRMWMFFIVIFLMNALFFGGDQPIWQWWIFSLSREGIIQGANVVIRVALAIVLGNILLSTTTPLEIVGAIETLIFPLKFIGVPVQDVAMILGAAIQFIPTFAQETDTIRKAQIARGARFESRKLAERAQSVVPLVVPIFLSAFRRADELSIAMEARGYHRTKKKARPRRRTIRPADVLVLLICCMLCAVLILIKY